MTSSTPNKEKLGNLLKDLNAHLEDFLTLSPNNYVEHLCDQDRNYAQTVNANVAKVMENIGRVTQAPNEAQKTVFKIHLNQALTTLTAAVQKYEAVVPKYLTPEESTPEKPLPKMSDPSSLCKEILTSLQHIRETFSLPQAQVVNQQVANNK